MSPNLEQLYKFFIVNISKLTYTSLKLWVDINIPSLYVSDLSSVQFTKFAKFVLHIDLSGIAVYLG